MSLLDMSFQKINTLKLSVANMTFDLFHFLLHKIFLRWFLRVYCRFVRLYYRWAALSIWRHWMFTFETLFDICGEKERYKLILLICCLMENEAEIQKTFQCLTLESSKVSRIKTSNYVQSPKKTSYVTTAKNMIVDVELQFLFRISFLISLRSYGNYSH